MFIQGNRSLRRSVASRIVPLALLALVLSGCASTAPDTGAGTPEPAAALPSTTATEPASEPTAATQAECIVGTWLLDNQSFADALATMAEAEGSFSDTLTGVARLVVSRDRSTQTEYENWKHVVEVNVEGHAATVTMERNGTDYGEIVEADGKLGLLEISNESVMVTSMNVGGVVHAAPPIGNTSLSQGIFECEADRLLTHVDGVTTIMNRVG